MLGLISQSFYGRSRGYGKITDDSDIKDVIALLDYAERQIARAWLRYVGYFRSGSAYRSFRAAYARGDIPGIVALLDEPFTTFLEIVPAVFNRTAELSTNEFADIFEVRFVKTDVDPSVDISFTPGNAEAAELVRQAQMEMIREILEAQREAIREAMRKALNAGMGPVEAGRLFRDSIDLTGYQNDIVDKYEAKLRARDPDALRAGLRDRRFDSTLRRAIRRDQDIAEEKIQRMVSRYRERFLTMRSETIARTEGLSVVNAARNHSAAHLADKIGLEMGRIIRVWRATQDPRTRHTHRSMNWQQRRHNERFRSPSGARLMYPGDRAAPAKERINCRCVVQIKVRPPQAPSQELRGANV